MPNPNATSHPNGASRRLRTSIVALALAASLVLVVKLSVQHRTLQARYAELFSRLSSAQPGYRVPWVPVVTLDGDSVTLGRPRAPVQVLFFYTSTCPHCRATIPAWNHIATRMGDVEVLGLQLDSNHVARQYRDSLGVELEFPPFGGRVNIGPLRRRWHCTAVRR